MRRRDFIKISALTTVGGVALSACATTVRRIASRVTAPEGNPVDGEVYFATTCAGCQAACGIVVRTVDGRAIKIEGNPEHPISQGKLCARGQASLQVLYHPERLRGPRKLAGERGSGKFQDIGWEEAISEVATRLAEAVQRGGDGSVLFFAGSADGHTGLVVDRFARALGGPGRIALETLPQAALRRANRITFGREALAEYDIDHADYVLSFGAGLLEGGTSAVRYGRGYGFLRQGRAGRRGRLVQVEPRLSLTAANADRWISVRPGSEGAFALGVARYMLANNLQSPASGIGESDLAGWRDAVSEFTPERVAELSGVAAGLVEEVARAFAEGRPSLAVGGDTSAGYTNAVSTLVAINALNVLAGNVGKEGGVRFAPPLPFPEPLTVTPTAFGDLLGYIERMRSGRVSAVLLHDANPAFTLPASTGIREALAQVPFIVSFGSFVDESTALADIVLPDHSYLERFDTRVPAGGTNLAVLSTAQPVVVPLYDTRATPDVLLAIAREMGGSVAQALPWGSFADLLHEAAAALQATAAGSVRAGSAEEQWERMLQHGGWWSDPTAASPVAVDAAATRAALRFEQPRFEGDPSAFPMFLHVYESAAFGDGRVANLTWLQEMPDPLTTVVWGSWVEMNPRKAAELGIQEGDLVEVESPRGKVSVPVYIYPGLPPDVVAMPLGQGHTAYGEYATNRGANPLDVLAPVAESQTGALAYQSTRVKISRTAAVARLITVEGQSQKLPGHAFFE